MYSYCFIRARVLAVQIQVSLENINQHTGTLEITVLSPPEVALVCPGERFEFVCSTSLDYSITWNVTHGHSAKPRFQGITIGL